MITFLFIILTVILASLTWLAAGHVTRKKRCPICLDQYPDQIQRPAWLKFMRSLMGSQAFHCARCGNQFIRIGRRSRSAM